MGVSIREVADVVRAFGDTTGIRKSEVSRICADLNTELEVFGTRPFSSRVPVRGSWRDRCMARVNHQVVVAVGVSTDGRHLLLGIDVGDSGSGRSGPYSCAH